MSSCISIQGIEMRFRGCEALQGVNLEVPTGSVFALLGENGAGKTTLIRILTGFQKPTRGQCTVCGLDPAVDALEIRRRVGYVSDSPALYDWMRVGEIGWFAASFFDDAFADRYRELIARYELPESRKIRHLSKGQRAKVALSLAVSHDPELLILDEPTSGLDPLVRREFLESMVDRAATGRTVLLSSHQISEVERVADRVAILRAGRVQLVDELAELKDSICLATITVDDPLAALPTLPGSVQLLSEQNEGRQRRWMVRGLTAEHVVELESLSNIVSVRTRAASLEEMFVACTRGIVPLRVAESSAAPPFTEPRSAVPT